MVGDIHGKLVRAKGNAVWFFHFASDLGNASIFFDAVHRLMSQFAGFGSAVTGIGEVNEPFQAHTHIVWRIESFALIAVGNRFALTGFQIPAPKATGASIRAITGKKVADKVESQAI